MVSINYARAYGKGFKTPFSLIRVVVVDMSFLKKAKKKAEEATKKGLEVGEKGVKKGVEVGKKAGKKGVDLGKKGVEKTKKAVE